MKYILGVGCGKRSGAGGQEPVVRRQRREGRSPAAKAMAPRNRTECDREFVTVLADRHTHKQAAGRRGPKPVLSAAPSKKCATATPRRATKVLMALPPASSGSISLSDCTDLEDTTPTWGFG